MNAYERGDYGRALALLQAAYTDYPSHLLLFNMAQTRRQLGLCAAAREDYLRYLDAETDPGRRGLAEVGLDRLRECQQPAASRTQKVSIAARPTPSTSGTPEAAPVWIAWAATGVLGAAWLTTASVALATKLEVDDAQAMPTTAARRRTLARRGEAWALSADILGIATLVGTGVSLAWTLTSDPPTDVGPEDDEDAPGEAPRATLHVGPGALFLRGAF